MEATLYLVRLLLQEEEQEELTVVVILQILEAQVEVGMGRILPVSSTHLLAHEIPEHIVYRIITAKKKRNNTY